MSSTKASRRRVKRSLNCEETPPGRAGFFILIRKCYARRMMEQKIIKTRMGREVAKQLDNVPKPVGHGV